MSLGKKGLFVVFEGIDGSGTSTHVHRLAERIEGYNKYQDVLKTHEPWNKAQIDAKLKGEKDAYSSAEELSELFVDDRATHVYKLIRPNVKAGVVVISSRYKMSTCAYQWTQGMDLSDLLEMHKERGILTPDLTFFVDVPHEIAQQRMSSTRSSQEKFETPEFANKLVNAYSALIYMAQVDENIFGKVVTIDGNREISDVSDEIFKEFLKVYEHK